MEDRLETHAEVADLVWIVLFDGLKQHADTFPVVFTEHGVVVRIQSRTLHNKHHQQLRSTVHQSEGSVL